MSIGFGYKIHKDSGQENGEIRQKLRKNIAVFFACLGALISIQFFRNTGG
jgi:hypothetical protein